ncbi:MAG: sigma-54-dependent Fis family transcriptional regulator [Deltaproteobacteria bacterium]|nr:sigma-54-dependent Fis family transcriptional regulator [Deltaproteobacteria bacterium]
MAHILIIDDDTMMSDMLSQMVDRMGHAATCVDTLSAGMESVGSSTYDVVLLDVRLPDGNGLDLLPEIRKGAYSPEVIIITAEGDPDGAELAIKNGAWDYIEKPSSVEKMSLPIIRALQYRDEKEAKKPPVALKRDSIIGNSPQMKACLDMLAQAANSAAPVLVFGETGTGKELFAWAIHENSSRVKKNFVVVDCAALPETLVESSLFGYKKGAFTGADKDMEGLIKQADGGTLFLDEIGELPLNLQKAFLRVLQEHRFRPVGSKIEIESNFRVVAASNRNLSQMVQRGQFRSDLLFRLESILIEIPALRERVEDVKELAMHYVAKLCERYGVETKGFSPEFFEALLAYEWSGNVRELVNTIEWALSAAQNDPTFHPRHLPPNIRIQLARKSIGKKSRASDGFVHQATLPSSLPKLQDFRDDVITRAEKQYLDELMSAAGNDVKKACSISGLSRPRLYAILKKYGISLSK